MRQLFVRLEYEQKNGATVADAGVFAPAEITINELNSAKSFTSGRINPEVLLKSFGVARL